MGFQNPAIRRVSAALFGFKIKAKLRLEFKVQLFIFCSTFYHVINRRQLIIQPEEFLCCHYNRSTGELARQIFNFKHSCLVVFIVIISQILIGILFSYSKYKNFYHTISGNKSIHQLLNFKKSFLSQHRTKKYFKQSISG